jgi:hypothetical protein
MDQLVIEFDEVRPIRTPAFEENIPDGINPNPRHVRKASLAATEPNSFNNTMGTTSIIPHFQL